MSSYPGAIYAPRTIENRPGVVYDALKSKVAYAEDQNLPNAEIVAIETALGINLANVAVRSGVAGGQTLKGGTGVADILKLQGTSGNGTVTSPAIQALVGNNGATVALTILNNGNVGVGTTAPDSMLVIQKDTSSATWGNYPSFTVSNLNTSGASYSVATFRSGNVVKSGLTGFVGRFYSYATSNTGQSFTVETADSTYPLYLGSGLGSNTVTIGNGLVGIGTTAPTAVLHLKAGTATANTAPLKFTSGVNNTTAVAGCMEYDNNLYFTISDSTRRAVVLAPNATKVTAAAPYTNDGYVVLNILGTDFKVMTTA